MKLTGDKLRDVILEGLEGAQSSEADRIREGLQWIAPSELRKLARTVNAAYDATATKVGQDEEE